MISIIALLSAAAVGAVKYTLLTDPCLHNEYKLACKANNLEPAIISDFSQVYNLLAPTNGGRAWIAGYQKLEEPIRQQRFLSVIIDTSIKDRKHLNIDLIDTEQDSTFLFPLCMEKTDSLDEIVFGSWRERQKVKRVTSTEKTEIKKKPKRAKKPVMVDDPSVIDSPKDKENPIVPKKGGHQRRSSMPTEAMRKMQIKEQKNKEENINSSSQQRDTKKTKSTVPPRAVPRKLLSVNSGGSRRPVKTAEEPNEKESESEVSTPFNVQKNEDYRFDINTKKATD